MRCPMRNILITTLTLLVFLVPPTQTIYAYGGGGGSDSATGDSTSSSSVNMSFTGDHNSASTGVASHTSNVTVVRHQHSQTVNNEIKSTPLTVFQWVETIGDVTTGGAQAGVYGYAVYCWYVGKTVVLVPVALAWHVPKHTTRTIYGITTGNLDTVHKVNNKTWVGRIVNGFVVEGLINVREGRKGNPVPYPGPTRTHAPVKDIIHFRGVK